MLVQIILAITATALVTVPQWFSSRSAARHAKRLLELRDGAPEIYFEERRSLETYRPRGRAWPYRLIGLIGMAYLIGSLTLRH